MKRILRKLLQMDKGAEKPVSSLDRDFSLTSGERQTGKKIEDVRYDHRVRYGLPIDYLKHNLSITDKLLGLDIFCGNGYGTYMLSKSLSCFLLGIEGSEEAINFANKHYLGQRIFYIHKLFPFELPLETFDFITCLESLEHIKDYAYMVEQLNRSLKKGGYLFLSTPNEKCWPYIKEGCSFHYKHFSKEEILGIVEKKTELKLINWYGQNIYKIKEGKPAGELNNSEMELSEREERQILIYEFKKINFSMESRGSNE